jgi:hypothetical protein
VRRATRRWTPRVGSSSSTSPRSNPTHLNPKPYTRNLGSRPPASLRSTPKAREAPKVEGSHTAPKVEGSHTLLGEEASLWDAWVSPCCRKKVDSCRAGCRSSTARRSPPNLEPQNPQLDTRNPQRGIELADLLQAEPRNPTRQNPTP